LVAVPVAEGTPIQDNLEGPLVRKPTAIVSIGSKYAMSWLRPSWWNTAIIVWTVGLIGIAVQGYLKPRTHTVFDIYAFGCEDWLAGRDIYIWQVQTDELYRYSPLFAVVTIPLAILPPGWGNALWKLLNGIIFIWAIRRWAHRGLPESPLDSRAEAFLLLLTIPVAMISLHIGQANLMLVAFCLVAFVAIREDKWWQAAAWIVGAILIKVIPLPLALVLGALFPLKSIGRLMACFAVGLVLPLLAQRPEYVLDQTIKWVKHLLASHEINQERNRNLRKLLEEMGYLLEPKTMLAIGVFAGLAVLLVSWWTYRRTGNRSSTLWVVGAWFFTWAMLHNPATEAASYGVISPFIAWAVLKSWRTPGAWVDRAMLLAGMALMGPIITDLGNPLRGIINMAAAPILGAILFQAWLVIDLWRILKNNAGERPMAGVIGLSQIEPTV